MKWTTWWSQKRRHWALWDRNGQDVARIVQGTDGVFRLVRYGSATWTPFDSLKAAKKFAEDCYKANETAYRLGCAAIVEADEFGTAD